MAFPLRRALGALAGALLLGACQAGADGSRAPVTRAAPVGPEAEAMRAFGRICGRLDRAEVARRGAEFGFAPVRSADMPPGLRDALAQTGGVIYMRPAGAPAMLIWDEPSSCELGVGGINVAALEREFARFLIGVEEAAAGSRVMVTRLTAEQVARASGGNGSRLRQGAMIGPRGLTPGPHGVMALRLPEQEGAIQALMIHRIGAPPTEGQPAAERAGQPKAPPR